MTTMFVNLVVLFLIMTVTGQQGARAGGLDSLNFLSGDWVGEGGGEPGQGTGTFSFNYELQKRIVVRRNHSDYPATKDKPAYLHEDLMVIYQKSEDSLRAMYFDNEGHIIEYAVQFSREPNNVTFVSEIKPSAPRFRLTYSLSNDDRMTIRFEIAPPGKPDAFVPYIEASAHRKQ